MEIHWIKILGITFAFSLILHFLIISGILADLIGAEGFFSHLVVVGWLFYLYPLNIVGSSLAIACWVENNKIHHFFITLLASLTINFILFNIMSIHGKIKTTNLTQQMYHNNPQSRPVLDPQRPLSIIDPLGVKQNVTSPINIVVHALPGVLESGKSRVEIRSEYYPDSTGWGEGTLFSNGEQAQGGRIIYTASVDFVPDKNWHSGIVIVKGINGEIETSHIQR